MYAVKDKNGKTIGLFQWPNDLTSTPATAEDIAEYRNDMAQMTDASKISKGTDNDADL